MYSDSVPTDIDATVNPNIIGSIFEQAIRSHTFAKALIFSIIDSILGGDPRTCRKENGRLSIHTR
jgi:hypothetical protein